LASSSTFWTGRPSRAAIDVKSRHSFSTLTPYSVADGDWLAMQFNRPELSDGLVLAYRRPACREDSLRLKLHGLEPVARYEVRSFDATTATVASGKDLLEQGLPVTLAAKPAAAVIRYRRTDAAPPR